MSGVTQGARAASRLPPEVNRVLFVRNLPFKITPEELFDIFGKFGALRQVRVGSTAETKGQAFVVYEDIYDAKAACEALSGFSVGGRYLVVHFFVPAVKATAPLDQRAMEAEVSALRARVAAGEAAAAAGGDDDALDDESDRRRAAAARSISARG